MINQALRSRWRRQDNDSGIYSTTHTVRVSWVKILKIENSRELLGCHNFWGVMRGAREGGLSRLAVPPQFISESAPLKRN
jgi:hypothetical protein